MTNVNESFWRWFLEHESELYTGEPAKDAVFDDLARQIGCVSSSLSFEFGPKQSVREVVISASGVVEAFPAAQSLAEDAPLMARWNVKAFRPRRPLPVTVEHQGVVLDSTTVEFSLLDNGKTAGVYLYIPGYEENATYKQIMYLLLDEAIGEFDVEMRLGLIKPQPFEAESSLRRYQFGELPSLFDRLTSRLERSRTVQ